MLLHHTVRDEHWRTRIGAGAVTIRLEGDVERALPLDLDDEVGADPALGIVALGEHGPPGTALGHADLGTGLVLSDGLVRVH